jgi:hypothetical protein
MGLRPTHRDESPTLAATNSKWFIRDFRRSVIVNVTYESDQTRAAMHDG